MRNWPLLDGAAAAPPARAGAALAGMVDAIGTADFAARLHGAVAAVVPGGALSAYLLARDRPPELVASIATERPDCTAACWQHYRGSLYRTDRSFEAAWRRDGTSLTHCTQASFEPAHRVHVYVPLRSHERLSITQRQDDGRLLAVNLYRTVGQPGFDADDAARAAAIALPLLACVRQQARRQASPPPASPPGVRTRLAARCDRLTGRELDVLEQLARGCTYDGIAAALGLSVATVKTYRERAFLKLGLHFRSELCGLLIDEA